MVSPPKRRHLPGEEVYTLTNLRAGGNIVTVGSPMLDRSKRNSQTKRDTI